MALKTMEKDKEKGLCHCLGRDHQDWPLLGRSWGVNKGGIESHKADRVLSSTSCLQKSES